MAADLLIGVEGGATRTTGVLADAGLHVLAEHVAGPSNVHAVGEAGALAAVTDLLGALAQEAGGRWPRVRASAFCMAGLRGEADRAVWRRLVTEAGAPGAVHLTHDAAAALAAGSPDLTGILVVSGTGSVVYGRAADGREHWVGGRGPVLGDEGSGFDIGREALRAAARAADNCGPPTALGRLIPARLGLADLEDLIAWVSPFAKDRIASVAPIVFEAAADGDAVAEGIVRTAADELTRGVEAVAARLWPDADGEAPARVVLSGGVLRAQAGFRRTLAAMIASATRGAPAVPPEVGGAVGAARIAQRAAERPGAFR
jgi:N-acetylglucosamine kinase-like BadF-type ATPase